MNKPWNEDRPRVRRVATVNDLESKTVQSDRNRADIKKILEKYDAVGIVDHLRKVDLQFRDATEFTDFADQAQQFMEAEAEFMSQPARFREIFDHSVSKWLDAAHNPNALEELRPRLTAAGFLKAPEVAEVIAATEEPSTTVSE